MRSCCYLEEMGALQKLSGEASGTSFGQLGRHSLQLVADCWNPGSCLSRRCQTFAFTPSNFIGLGSSALDVLVRLDVSQTSSLMLLSFCPCYDVWQLDLVRSGELAFHESACLAHLVMLHGLFGYRVSVVGLG